MDNERKRSMPAPSRALSPTQQRIHSLLLDAPRPLSAYDLLARLKHEGVNAPPTVYRALERLVREGLAYRIETLNAFVAWSKSRIDEMPIFSICASCGGVASATDRTVEEGLRGFMARSGFHLHGGAIELRGICRECAEKERG